MWQTDTEQSEALEQVGAERPVVLVNKNNQKCDTQTDVQNLAIIVIDKNKLCW